MNLSSQKDCDSSVMGWGWGVLCFLNWFSFNGTILTNKRIPFIWQKTKTREANILKANIARLKIYFKTVMLSLLIYFTNLCHYIPVMIWLELPVHCFPYGSFEPQTCKRTLFVQLHIPFQKYFPCYTNIYCQYIHCFYCNTCCCKSVEYLQFYNQQENSQCCQLVD